MLRPRDVADAGGRALLGNLAYTLSLAGGIPPSGETDEDGCVEYVEPVDGAAAWLEVAAAEEAEYANYLASLVKKNLTVCGVCVMTADAAERRRQEGERAL